MINNIKLETGFYNSFKNTIKKLLLNPLYNRFLLKIKILFLIMLCYILRKIERN